MRFGVVVPSYGPLAHVDDVSRLILAAERLGYESAAGVEEQFEAFATEVMSRYPSKGAQARGSGVA